MMWVMQICDQSSFSHHLQSRVVKPPTHHPNAYTDIAMLLPSVWARPWGQPGRCLAVDCCKFDRPAASIAHLPWSSHCYGVALSTSVVSRRAIALLIHMPSALPATAPTSADADWSPEDHAALTEGDYGCVGIVYTPVLYTPIARTDGCGHTCSPRLVHTAAWPSRCKTARS